jgi:hypothetical protein
MTRRYLTVLFLILMFASAVMGGLLWHLRNRAHQRLLTGQESTPTQAPAVAPVEQATLFVANDAEDSLEPRTLTLPLPASPPERARAVLGKLFDLYAAQGSTHPVPGGAASIKQVFLLPVSRPQASGPNPAKAPVEPKDAPQLAVVNLSGSFAFTHPSGIEAETLTMISICATLHANLPSVAQVRFLVDGQTRNTLAGHADLSRTYLTADAAATTIPISGAKP